MQSSQQVKSSPELNQNQKSYIYMIYHLLQNCFGAAAFSPLEGGGTKQNSIATCTTANNQTELYDPRDPGTITLNQAHAILVETLKVCEGKSSPSLSSAYNQLGTAYHRLGTAENNIGQLQMALQYYNSALTIDLLLASKNQAHFYNVSVTCNYIGMVYCDLSDLESSLQYHKAALRIKTVFSNQLKTTDISVADSYNNIANVHYYLGNTDEAIKCYKDAIRVANHCSQKPTPFLAKIYDNLAYLYQSIDNILFAKEYYKLELAIFSQLRLTKRMPEVIGYLSSLKKLKLKIDYKKEHGAQQDTDKPAENKVSADCVTLAAITDNSSPPPISIEPSLANVKSKLATRPPLTSIQGVFSSSQMKWKILKPPVANNPMSASLCNTNK